MPKMSESCCGLIARALVDKYRLEFLQQILDKEVSVTAKLVNRTQRKMGQDLDEILNACGHVTGTPTCDSDFPNVDDVINYNLDRICKESGEHMKVIELETEKAMRANDKHMKEFMLQVFMADASERREKARRQMQELRALLRSKLNS